jgi:hypothetical protein
MAFSVQNIKANLPLGGARPTLFRASFVNPFDPSADARLEFLIKASSLPASTVPAVEVPYMGRKIKVAGDRTFEDWEVTVMNDEDFDVRNAIETWSNAINGHVSNVQAGGSSAVADYKSEGWVEQLGKNGEPLRKYFFNGVWPNLIGAIETSWENNDQIEEFTVTFSVDWWTVEGNTGDAGGFPDGQIGS